MVKMTNLELAIEILYIYNSAFLDTYNHLI